VGNRASYLLLEEGVSYDPEVSLANQPELVPTVAASYVSGHRSGGAGGAKPAPTRRNFRRGSWLKRLQVWTTWKRCRSRPVHPEVSRSLLQISHADTSISVRFRYSRRSTPPDFSDGHLPDSTREERMLISPLSRAGAWKTYPRKGPPVLRRGPGAAPTAEAASPPWAGGPRAGQVRPPWT